MLVLPGATYLSSFRRQRLEEALRRAGVPLVELRSRWIYLCDLEGPAGPKVRAGLAELLALPFAPVAAWGAAGEAGVVVWTVVPRLGTQSPWSSKATDIARACGFTGLRRIEAGRQIALRLGGEPDPAALAAGRKLVYDRMTETVLDRIEAAAALFAAPPPAPTRWISLGDDPVAALRRADEELGLALSDEEIAYLARAYDGLGRTPSDAELMMFAQVNSEHCRHKIFNATWEVEGREDATSLFDRIRRTYRAAPAGILSAYRDNGAVLEGPRVERLQADPATGAYGLHREAAHLVIKVETHNHPTAISPFAGAATGAGGEIRDEGATGRGARPKAGLCGFWVSHLELPETPMPWELGRPRPARLATPLEIMLDGPIGAAAFNNEFGRPNLAGVFRTFEVVHEGDHLGYHKPIMVAGGLGAIRPVHVKKEPVPPGAPLVVLGGPGMLIGLGGGAASSVASGDSAEDLDFASVQRGNPDMQRRAQQVIESCTALGPLNPILVIHDVGAGGLSNALPEVVDHSKLGAQIDLRAIPVADPGLSPMEIWCNEAQERYVLALAPASLPLFRRICERERCPFAVVGHTTAERRLVVLDSWRHERVVDLPMGLFLGETPRRRMRARRSATPPRSGAAPPPQLPLAELLDRVLRFPAVSDKTFLITIADRTVGGLTCRDQMVGPWQVPVADVAVTAAAFSGWAGEAMAMGERPPVALLDAPASGRLAVGEAVTNIAAAPIADLRKVRLSANWMAACGTLDQDSALFETVESVTRDVCVPLGLAIPVGKDSLSMRTRWRDEEGEHAVRAPLSLVVSAFAPVVDVRRVLTPELRDGDEPTVLVLIDLGAGAQRLGGSVAQQVESRIGGPPPDLDAPERLGAFFDLIQELNRRELVLAYHDRSDGGLAVTLLEMAFAGRCGLEVDLAVLGGDPRAALFNEELGAVLQIRAADLEVVRTLAVSEGLADLLHPIGHPLAGADVVRFLWGGAVLYEGRRGELHRAWSALSHAMQRHRDDPDCADEAYAALADPRDRGLFADLPTPPPAPPLVRRRPPVAILREQGVNSHLEMAAAFHRAGFDPLDLTMTDLARDPKALDRVVGLAACGGFSYGDVLGAGVGWARSILHREALAEAFARFFERPDTFTLGVCNGCQMLAHLRQLIPGSEAWPYFVRNRSEQFEARLSLVRIARSPSIFLTHMQDWVLPIAVSHGEGRAWFADEDQLDACRRGGLIATQYVDGRGEVATRYPANPNGSPLGIAAVTTPDGRVTLSMPHPERVFRTVQCSWHPPEWGEESPWMTMFRSAYRHVVG